jgi:hypothetical protein
LTTAESLLISGWVNLGLTDPGVTSGAVGAASSDASDSTDGYGAMWTRAGFPAWVIFYRGLMD